MEKEEIIDKKLQLIAKNTDRDYEEIKKEFLNILKDEKGKMRYEKALAKVHNTYVYITNVNSFWEKLK